jgi:hypothetical protein
MTQSSLSILVFMDILTFTAIGTTIPILIIYFTKKLYEFLSPPYLAHHIDGTITDQADYNKLLHRLDGPAVIIRGHRAEYWVEGKLHRLDGPAIIEYGIGGSQYFFIRGVEFPKEKFYNIKNANKQQIAEHLLSANLETRILAEHRAKEIYEQDI